jgi:hypothetical protein
MERDHSNVGVPEGIQERIAQRGGPIVWCVGPLAVESGFELGVPPVTREQAQETYPTARPEVVVRRRAADMCHIPRKCLFKHKRI